MKATNDAAGAACLAAALEYREWGWSPLALCTPDHVGMEAVARGHSKSCSSPGKRPWHTWKEFQSLPASVAQIRGWWERNPWSNVGIALGPVSGLVGVDLDGPKAREQLQQLSQGDLPPTLEFRTGNGGRLLYAVAAGTSLCTTIKPLVVGELRFQWEGAQTVMPPSRHPSGGVYEWVPGHGPHVMQAAPAPAWLLRLLAPTTKAADDRPDTPSLSDGELIGDGRRNTTLTSLAGTVRNRGLGYDEIFALLTAVNSCRCDPPLPEEDLRVITASICRYPTDGVPDSWAGTTFLLPRIGGGVAGTVSDSNPEWTDKTWTHPKLMAEHFPEVPWLVEGLIPADSFILLAAPAKAGKSWFALQTSIAVAQGLPVLGRKTRQGTVLYLALEDGPRRVQGRVGATRQNAPADLPIRWLFDLTKLDQGGLDEMDWLIGQIKPTFVVLDTLAAAKSGKVDENAAGVMADIGNAIRVMAQERKVTIIVVVHQGKGVHGGTAGYDVRGSSALPAAADGTMGLYRTGEGSAAVWSLRGEGRDVEPFDIPIYFDVGRSWTWIPREQAKSDGVLPKQQEAAEADMLVIMAIRQEPGISSQRLAARLQLELGKVKSSVSRLKASGLIETRRTSRTGDERRGHFAVVEPEKFGTEDGTHAGD